MKRFSLLLICLIFSNTILAQNIGALNITVVDKKDSSPLPGAIINLINSKNQSRLSATSEDGRCRFSQTAFGEYKIEATFIGYDTIRQNVTINKDIVNLEAIKMSETSLKINNVTVMGTAIRTSQSGDTVIYNADAFKVTADAVAEGLLEKMPGITVDDGEVEAQGEAVKKVYVDGKEFFGEDVTLAVKNIPADIIAKIEVFNKLSDNAEFTGFDDGDSYKAINIVTRTGMNRGQFGKFTAGYAFDNLYQVSANYSYFTNNHRITLIGSSNNMNIKGFGAMTVGGGGKGGGRQTNNGGASFGGSSTPSSGLSTASSIGFNYGGSFLEEKLKIDGSYFYNQTNNENWRNTDRQYITDTDDSKRYFTSSNDSESDNYNHRVNTKIEYKPNERHSFMMRPEFAFQDNGSGSISLQNNKESSDGLTFTELNDIENSTSSDRNAYNISNNMVYRALIGQSGRNIMLTANGNYSINDSRSFTSTLTEYPDKEEEIEKQDIQNDTESYRIGASVMYSEPVMDKNGMLTLKYNVNHNYSDADYLVYKWEQQENMFNTEYDPTSSNIYNSGYTTHNIGPGFMYSVPKSLSLNANVSYQSSSLTKEQEMPTTESGNSLYTFNNFIYSMMMRKTFNPTNTLRVLLRSNTQNPSVGDLQDVVKDSNPQNVSSGNSTLDPSYSNNISATYIRSNIEKGRTFMASVSGNITSNYIGDSTIMLLNETDEFMLPNGNMLAQYGKYTRPINMDGNWRITSNLTYGTPIIPLYSNLNFNVGASYAESPSIFNGINNLNMTSTYKAGVSLGSNISQNVDFTISYTGGYNIANYKYDTGTSASKNNEYFTNRLNGNFKFVFWAGITLSANASYSQYKGITDDFNQEYIYTNIYIGKKVFKNQRGEITFGVNDLFNQTENFSRNITESYIENVYSNSIGRYYGFKFTFDLRKFNGKSPMQNRPQRGEGMEDGMRQGGMGGGMRQGGMGGMGGMGGGGRF